MDTPLGFLADTNRCDCGAFQNASPIPGIIHLVGFAVIVLSGIFGPSLVWFRLRTDLRWRFAAQWTFWQAVSMPLLVIVVQLLMPVFSSFYLWLAAVLAWLGMLGVQLWRIQPQTRERSA